MRIYLAGGMRPRPIKTFLDKQINFDLNPTGHTYCPSYVTYPNTQIAWVDIVKQYLQKGHDVFDPRESQTKDFPVYSFVDKLELRKCDVVIAYLEEDNPSGFGLAAEIAYAHELGKTVLLINEKFEDRYIRFIENFADLVYHELKDAIPAIQRIRP